MICLVCTNLSSCSGTHNLDWVKGNINAEFRSSITVNTQTLTYAYLAYVGADLDLGELACFYDNSKSRYQSWIRILQDSAEPLINIELSILYLVQTQLDELVDRFQTTRNRSNEREILFTCKFMSLKKEYLNNSLTSQTVSNLSVTCQISLRLNKV